MNVYTYTIYIYIYEGIDLHMNMCIHNNIHSLEESTYSSRKKNFNIYHIYYLPKAYKLKYPYFIHFKMNMQEHIVYYKYTHFKKVYIIHNNIYMYI